MDADGTRDTYRELGDELSVVDVGVRAADTAEGDYMRSGGGGVGVSGL